jgi:hypothetical protein
MTGRGSKKDVADISENTEKKGRQILRKVFRKYEISVKKKKGK